MSLLDKASLIVTSNAYKTSKLYSVIPNTTLGDMDVVRATTATKINASGLIESVGVNIPRIDYTNGSCPSLLVEPQRTNLLLQSNNFNTTWTKSDVTLTPNTIISPDGTLNAFENIEGTGISTKLILQSVTVSSGAKIALYFFVKKKNRKYIQIRDNPSVSSFVFNFDTALAEDILGSCIPFIENYGNGWYKVGMTATASLTTSQIRLYHCDNSKNIVYTGDGISGFYLWGSQLEQGAYPTSYIPTVASTVTRNADVISKTGISSLIGQTEGTIYAEIKVNKLIGIASRYIFHISDGTANNRIYIAFSDASSNVLRGRIFNGSTLQCSIDTSTITTTGTYKLALAYKNNDIVFYVNGVQIGVDTSATIPTCSRVDIGHNYAGASQLGDGIANTNIFKTRLTNTELQLLTTL